MHERQKQPWPTNLTRPELEKALEDWAAVKVGLLRQLDVINLGLAHFKDDPFNLAFCRQRLDDTITGLEVADKNLGLLQKQLYS